MTLRRTLSLLGSMWPLYLAAGLILLHGELMR
jgi:hypothetical protein